MAEIEVRSSEGVCYVSGELDLASAAEFHRFVTEAADPSRELVLDVGGLTFVDSTGMRAIARLASSCRHGVVLRHPRPVVRKVFDIVQMEKMPGIRLELD
jgi:anti-anti-sigma factor